MSVLRSGDFGDGYRDAEGGALGAHLVRVLPDDKVVAGGRHDPRHGPRLEARGRGLKAVRAPVGVNEARLLWGIVNRGALKIENYQSNLKGKSKTCMSICQ